MGQHLDNPEKTGLTKLGRPVLFHWLESMDLQKIERTWLNIHIEHEGVFPELNRVVLTDVHLERAWVGGMRHT